MPSSGKHLRNAERHYRAARVAAENEATRSWAAVALFYSAHQLVHAVLDFQMKLAPELRHPESHAGPTGTSKLVAELFRPTALAYKSLFATGKTVRYMGQLVTAGDFDGLLMHDYRVVRDWAAKELRSQGRHAPKFLEELL